MSFVRFKWIFILLLFCIVIIPFKNSAQSKFYEELFVVEQDTLPYNILKPLDYLYSLRESQEKIFETKTYPLILFLHGAGERGNDNKKQIIHIKDLFLDSSNLVNYQAFVIAPQCPEGKKWVEIDWSAQSHKMPEKASWAIENTIKLIDEMIQIYPIDTSRIYITGLSMGGYGAWDMITRYPEKFAAAIPICGGGDESMAYRIKNIPVWAFHGNNDKVVPVSRTRNMIKSVRQLGGNSRYTEYNGVGHGSWVKAYREKGLLNWLFEQ